MSYCSVFDSSSFGNCLADLSVSELLTLKHSLTDLQARNKTHDSNSVHMNCSKTTEEICEKPTSLALVAEKRGYEISHPNYQHWQPEEKPSKLQTLFQISVTALAFLSFGGYLLCLIVQSIKSKGTTYFQPVGSTMASTSGLRRIKIYRRSRRSPPTTTESSARPHIIYSPYNYYQSKYNKYN